MVASAEFESTSHQHLAMLPTLQPSRPKPPQQRLQPSYAQQQQRSTYAPSHVFAPQRPQDLNASNPPITPNPHKPQSQIEAMPPQPPFFPKQAFYDTAVRHPVFMTNQLRKPPFPIPEIASRGWSPVASGYIMEARVRETNGIPKTKL